MKKHSKGVRTTTAVLTRRDLAAVVGGHNGTIIVESAVPDPRGTSGGALPRGIEGSGHP